MQKGLMAAALVTTAFLLLAWASPGFAATKGGGGRGRGGAGAGHASGDRHVVGGERCLGWGSRGPDCCSSRS